jgi:adenine-specific DNA-methyltransferase
LIKAKGKEVPEAVAALRHGVRRGEPLCPSRLRASRAEVDEAAWCALYSTFSRPFDPPKTGRNAVKVINHYGDEVSKVYPVTGR